MLSHWSADFMLQQQHCSSLLNDIFPFNVWSRSSSFPILKTLAFFRPTNLASEPTILLKRLYCLFSLTFTLLLTNCSSPYWPCLMSLLLSTWSTTKSSLSVLRPRVESHLSLFFGSNLTSLTVLK